MTIGCKLAINDHCVMTEQLNDIFWELAINIH